MFVNKALSVSVDTGAAAQYADKPAELYPFLIESLTEFAVFAVASDGSIMSWNSGAQLTFGYRQAEIIGKNFSLIFTADDVAAGAPAEELASALAGAHADYDRWHVRKDGSRFWGTNTVQPIFDTGGALLGVAKLVRDNTTRYLALQALSDSEERMRLLIESVHEYAIFSVALEGTITTWNVGAEATFGYLEHEIVGRPLSALFTADDVVADVPAAQLRAATAHGQCAEERWLVRKDGTRFFASCRISQLKRGPDAVQRGFVNIAHDITERKRIADEMRRRASSDQLTELPNRVAFYEHVGRAIAAIKRRAANLFAVLFIDLDHFKAVNDTYGHVVADKLLAFTARRLEGCVRSEDIIARLGGDEFAILLNSITGLADAIDAGDRIGVEMSRPVSIDGNDLHVTASVGIALGSTRYEQPEDILRDADTAMYCAKTNGRARSVVFASAMGTSKHHRRDLDIDLPAAVERNELRIAYQPIVELASGSIAGFEALVRWQHPVRGLLQPPEFMHKAQERNAIVPIDRWVFRTACEQFRAWQSAGIADAACTLNVNLSSKQFSRLDLVDALRDMLGRSGLEARCVRLEISANVLPERSDQTTALMNQIRALGLEIHIDDFGGVGYSSLAALGHLPVTALKIDRSFVANMNTDKGSKLVGAIVSLAHNLGLIAIAQGVESADQLRLLNACSCDYAQGFFFSKPLDAPAAANLLGASRAGAA
jgi:diguanylate cyclase (GGDEF)-like protein/PAS domain S-box-containing protein